ncbi:ABC transporter permease, partial [Pediococcus pentosaceus]|nr:ABC transporter permease [Pediococcus pentosaceus]
RRAFHGQQNHFEKMMGIKLEWHHLLTGMQTAVFLIVIFLLGIVALLTVDLIRSKKNVRTVD